MFGGSVFYVKNLEIIGKNSKLKSTFGKINMEHKVQEQMKLQLMQIIEVQDFQKWLIQ